MNNRKPSMTTDLLKESIRHQRTIKYLKRVYGLTLEDLALHKGGTIADVKRLARKFNRSHKPK